MMKRLAVLTLLTSAALLPAQAHDAPEPQGVLLLSSSATVEVTKDLLSVVLSTSREGSDAAAVQGQLKQALDAALTEARRVAKPGQLDVQTGNFSLFPRYDRNGRISGWQGSTELLIEGRDMPAIGALAARIGTLSVARVSHAVSRELREKVEGDAAAQAIARFRVKAAEQARAFGYAGYAVREVNVSAADLQQPAPMMAMRGKVAAASADESLPVEAGKGTVVVSVSGSVQMTR